MTLLPYKSFKEFTSDGRTIFIEVDEASNSYCINAIDRSQDDKRSVYCSTQRDQQRLKVFSSLDTIRNSFPNNSLTLLA